MKQWQYYYLTLEEVTLVHDLLVSMYWGLSWISDNITSIEGVLGNIQNNERYPTLLDKACHLCFSLISFHGFLDGNKRTALEVTNIFLSVNEYEIPEFIVKMEDVALGIAKGILSKDDLHKVIKSMILSAWYKE